MVNKFWTSKIWSVKRTLLRPLKLIIWGIHLLRLHSLEGINLKRKTFLSAGETWLKRGLKLTISHLEETWKSNRKPSKHLCIRYGFSRERGFCWKKANLWVNSVYCVKLCTFWEIMQRIESKNDSEINRPTFLQKRKSRFVICGFYPPALKRASNWNKQSKSKKIWL